MPYDRSKKKKNEKENEIQKKRKQQREMNKQTKIQSFSVCLSRARIQNNFNET